MRRGNGTGFAALLCASVLVSACAGRSVPSPFSGDEAEEITLEVENNNYLDVVVFGMQDHSATRLGSVTGLGSATLTVPGRLVIAGQLRLLVDPIGSPEAYLSDDIFVNPGDVVVLRVGSTIRHTSWSIRSDSDSRDLDGSVERDRPRVR